MQFNTINSNYRIFNESDEHGANQMKDIHFLLKNHNDPFVQGFCSFFMQNFNIFYNFDLEEYGGKKGLVRQKKITLSDHTDCDIGLVNLDSPGVPLNQKITFCNGKNNYREREYFFPYLQNASDEAIQIHNFNKNNDYEKLYKCTLCINTFTHPIRENLPSIFMDLCDVIIIDGKVIKRKEDSVELNYWDILKHSQFCICPPGHIAETYRFYEALLCDCIPLELGSHCKRIEDFGTNYILDGIRNPNKINEITYSREELRRVQKNIDRNILIEYLVRIISSNDIG